MNGLSLFLSALTVVMSYVAYISASSGLRIFTLGAAKKLLEPGISFNMENSFSDSKYRLIQWLDVMVAGRYFTVDLPLKRGYSPASITAALTCSLNIVFISIACSAIETYLACPTKGCFNQGEGSLLSFFVSADTLDTTSPYSFIFLMALAIPMIIMGTLSKKANIFEYIEQRKENPPYIVEDDIENQMHTANNPQSLVNPVAAISPKTSKDDARVIHSIQQPESLDLIVKENNSFPSMTWLNLKNNVDYRNDGKISTISFAAIFGAPNITNSEQRDSNIHNMV